MSGPVFEKIRKIVSHVPYGKVVSYGQVAKIAGINNARVVGWAMRGNQNKDVPCHRVVRSDGFLAPGFSLGGWQGQKKRLVQEGVSFIGERQVDLRKHLWRK